MNNAETLIIYLQEWSQIIIITQPWKYKFGQNDTQKENELASNEEILLLIQGNLRLAATIHTVTENGAENTNFSAVKFSQ